MPASVRPLFLLLFFAAGCTRSFPVYDAAKLSSVPATRDYLYYALPRTVVTVDVPITKIVTVTEGAPCLDARYDDMRTRLLLGAPEAGVGFKAGKPAVGNRSEPDPSAIYAVDLKFRALALTSGTFEMTDSGVLTTATISQEDQAFDTVLSVAKLALTASGTLPLAGATARTTKPPASAQDEACKRTEADIVTLREKRLAIIGDSIQQEAPSKEYLEAMLEKIDALEESLTSAFVGTTTKTVATVHCEWRPTGFDPKGRALFEFSGTSGPRPVPGPCVIPRSVQPKTGEVKIIRASLRAEGREKAEDEARKAGKSPADVTKAGDAAEAALTDPILDVIRWQDVVPLAARVDSDSDNGVQFADRVKTLARPSDATARGFYYRVPASAIVSVDFGADPRVREVTPIAQLGAVTTLPTLGGAFVRKASMTPTLNAAGGLQKLVLNGEPGGNAALSGAADLYTGVLTARAAEDAAKLAAKDELALLERQRKILEEKQKIAEAEAALAELAGGGSNP